MNGLDWGYDFGPRYGAIANPDKYLPWKTKYANIAYGFHPYQHGACCGSIGASGTDESATDPYQSGFCSYYPDGSDWGAPSGAALPGGKTCTNKGYAATQDKKMPPCTWVASAFNPMTHAMGLCAGDRTVCNGKSESECKAVDWSVAERGGWSRYALPMAKYGPLIATEFGSFDCSSGFSTTLMKFMGMFDISYTAWALWPQNSGGPEGPRLVRLPVGDEAGSRPRRLPHLLRFSDVQQLDATAAVVGPGDARRLDESLSRKSEFGVAIGMSESDSVSRGPSSESGSDFRISSTALLPGVSPLAAPPVPAPAPPVPPAVPPVPPAMPPPGRHSPLIAHGVQHGPAAVACVPPPMDAMQFIVRHE